MKVCTTLRVFTFEPHSTQCCFRNQRICCKDLPLLLFFIKQETKSSENAHWFHSSSGTSPSAALVQHLTHCALADITANRPQRTQLITQQDFTTFFSCVQFETFKEVGFGLQSIRSNTLGSMRPHDWIAGAQLSAQQHQHNSRPNWKTRAFAETQTFFQSNHAATRCVELADGTTQIAVGQ